MELEEAKGLGRQFQHNCAERFSVKGNVWCWAYALSLAFGAELVQLDLPLRVSRGGEPERQREPTAHDQALVKDVLALLQVSPSQFSSSIACEAQHSTTTEAPQRG